MRILILGGYGLIGAAVLLRLLAAGHVVTGLGRSVATARHRYPEVTWLEHDIALLTKPENWYHLIEDIDGVVNCAGALQDSARDDIRAVQSIAMRALFAACGHKGVRRFVQISAVGASADAKTAFMRTKGEADDALAKQDFDWVILRPGLVIAPYAYGATALIRALASIPVLVPLADGDAVIQTVHVDDVADAVSLAVAGQVPNGIYDLVEEKSHSLRELVRSWRAWLGYAPAPIIPVPSALAYVAFGMGDVLGWLGWRSPLRSTALQQIKAGVTGDAAAWRAATGRTPSSLSETLRRIPASVQERWFARLWILKPMAIVVLALFWLLSGLLALSNINVATSLLTARGLGLQEANVVVASGAILDVLLGLAVVFHRSMPWAALGMMATTAAYLLAGSVIAPDLWNDPLGPYVKTVPAAVLALIVWAVAEER